jgi:hypothetical protein
MVYRENNITETREHCYRMRSIQEGKVHDPFTLTDARMLERYLALFGLIPKRATEMWTEIRIKGSHQHCYHPGCQEQVITGVGMKKHVPRDHNGREPPPDLGMRAIIVEHLKKNPDATLWDIFEEKSACVCKHATCRYTAKTEKAIQAHVVQQHNEDPELERAKGYGVPFIDELPRPATPESVYSVLQAQLATRWQSGIMPEQPSNTWQGRSSVP